MDEDEAVARMRAADPAAGAEPDSERLARLTAERRGDELAARRAGRRPRWAAVAAVAAGALVVGGGAGFGLGRVSDEPGAPSAGSTARTEETTGDLPALAGPESLSGADTMAADRMTFPAGGERTTFTAQGLSDAAGTAAAWAFDGAGTVSADAAARAAAVLGVDGEPRQEGGWVVGTTDGTGPSVHLMPDGTATLMYQDPQLYELVDGTSPVPIPEPAGEPEPRLPESGQDGAGVPADPGTEPDDAVPPDAAVSSGGSGSSGDVGAAPQEPQEPTAVEPDENGPAGALHETLAALGLDPEAAEYEIQHHWAGDQVTSVTAHQLVEGRRTGQSWHADVVEGELYSFTGPLAPLGPLGEYDVVSPAQAVERLADPRFGATPVWPSDVTTMPMLPEAPERDWDEPPGPPPAAGEALPWPVTDVTIVDAEPTLTQHGTANGSVLLLPAYELSDAEGRAWSVLAVADHELAF